jgi:2,4-dienoyl-CoA reductase-like NADH-dependent reductase (Old Yellow Enzyme family)
MEHRKFNYRNLNELRDDISLAGVNLHVPDNLDILKTPLTVYDKVLSNRLGIHPMEGCDGTVGGAPGKLTLRRYERFSEGGAALLWVEACAITNEGRANPRQIFINTGILSKFRNMFDMMIEKAEISSNENIKPYTVLQLTHSGRYSKPNIDASAIIAVKENPYLDKFTNPKRIYITDEQLHELENKYVEAAKLARDTGFDAVDVKACHRYLINELLSAHTREGEYGGSFENRTRFMLNIIDKIKAEVDINITLRMNAYDAIPYPYGWGTDENGAPSLEEPKRLMKLLKERGIRLINLSTGNPYYNPHIGRPADIGPYTAAEHPIESASRMFNIIKELKSAAPEIVVMGTGFSWFREFGANIAAGCIENGWMDIAGFGRQAFAYPDFAKDITDKGGMIRRKCCIACTKCTELMRYGGQTGCVIKDSKVYLPLWREATNGNTIMNNRLGLHI